MEGSAPNYFFKRFEVSLVISLIITAVSLFAFGVSGLNPLRPIAAGIAISLIVFLLYPEVRGVRKGDLITIPIWREINTPFIRDSFLENTSSIALENGKKNQKIKIRLWDGSEGIAEVLNYGFIKPPGGKLIEAQDKIKWDHAAKLLVEEDDEYEEN